MKKLLKNLRCVPAILGAGALSGCATIFCGPSEDIEIDSFPSGASVYANGDFVGKTPLTVEMNRDSHPLIILKKDGYADTRLQIKQEGNWVGVLNVALIPILLFPPFIGLGLDGQSGADIRYAEDEVVIPMLKENEYRMLFRDGNVSVTNANPSPVILAAEKSLREALHLKAQGYVEPVWSSVINPKTGAVEGRIRATGTAWGVVSLSEDGKISSYNIARDKLNPRTGSYRDACFSTIKSAARSVFKKLQGEFVAPESAASILPTTITVPVEFTK